MVFPPSYYHIYLKVFPVFLSDGMENTPLSPSLLLPLLLLLLLDDGVGELEPNVVLLVAPLLACAVFHDGVGPDVVGEGEDGALSLLPAVVLFHGGTAGLLPLDGELDVVDGDGDDDGVVFLKPPPNGEGDGELLLDGDEDTGEELPDLDPSAAFFLIISSNMGLPVGTNPPPPPPPPPPPLLPPPELPPLPPPPPAPDLLLNCSCTSAGLFL